MARKVYRRRDGANPAGVPAALYATRQRLRLSQVEIAKRIGCDGRTYSFVERGQAEPSFFMLLKLGLLARGGYREVIIDAAGARMKAAGVYGCVPGLAEVVTRAMREAA